MQELVLSASEEAILKINFLNRKLMIFTMKMFKNSRCFIGSFGNTLVHHNN